MDENKWNTTGLLYFGNLSCSNYIEDYRFKCGYFAESPIKSSFNSITEQEFDQDSLCLGEGDNGEAAIFLINYEIALGEYDNNIFGCMIYDKANVEKNSIGMKTGSFVLGNANNKIRI